MIIQSGVIFVILSLSILESVTEEISTEDFSIQEDTHLLVPELLRKYGYPSEIHYATTKDGYILTVHRIPRPNAQPVFLQHGILDSSATWIIMGTKVGLGYMLYDLGYDVWMGNFRGNTYSKNHTTLQIDAYEFWDFSWHESGVQDLPAMIDYVINVTKYEKLHYIAHSQGTTAFWVMCSKLPEYNKKILLMQALAPVAYMDGIKSPVINLLIRILSTAEAISEIIGLGEFIPSQGFLSKAGQTLCQMEAISKTICANVLFLLCGFDTSQLNTTMVPIALGHTPAGASVGQIVHYGQLGRSGKFREYDYGRSLNMKYYNNTQPPDYDLNQITAPIIFHYTKNDWISGWKDVEKLYKHLKNASIKLRYLVSRQKFNHLDFVWAVDVRHLLYNKVVSLMQTFEKIKT